MIFALFFVLLIWTPAKVDFHYTTIFPIHGLTRRRLAEMIDDLFRARVTVLVVIAGFPLFGPPLGNGRRPQDCGPLEHKENPHFN